MTGYRWWEVEIVTSGRWRRWQEARGKCMRIVESEHGRWQMVLMTQGDRWYGRQVADSTDDAR